MKTKFKVHHFFKDFQEDKTEFFKKINKAKKVALSYFEGQPTTSFSAIYENDKLIAFRIHDKKTLTWF